LEQRYRRENRSLHDDAVINSLRTELVSVEQRLQVFQDDHNVMVKAVSQSQDIIKRITIESDARAMKLQSLEADYLNLQNEYKVQ
jgi:hypothetical protein